LDRSGGLATGSAAIVALAILIPDRPDVGEIIRLVALKLIVAIRSSLRHVEPMADD